MVSRPVMNATERFKAMFGNACEQLCVAEAQIEQLQARLAEAENAVSEKTAELAKAKASLARAQKKLAK